MLFCNCCDIFVFRFIHCYDGLYYFVIVIFLCCVAFIFLHRRELFCSCVIFMLRIGYFYDMGVCFLQFL
jgi:hypothetical protein